MRDDRDQVGDAASRGDKPSVAEIRAQLERILRSKCFETAGRASKFLRYVVEETVAGRAERLKGYTLAVEVFERSADFDAQTDPLVRVEAGRLRRRLIEYYADEGRSDPLLLELPRGSYAVASSYTARAARAEAGTAADGERPRRPPREAWRSHLTLLSVVVLAVAVVGAVVVISMSGVFAPRAPVQPAAAADPLASGGSAAIVVVPFDVLDADDRSRMLAVALTEELLLELDEHELFATAIEPAALGAERAAPAAPNPNRYVLTGSVRDTPDGVRITARLVLASTGAQLWSASYDESAAIVEVHEQQTAVARRIAGVAAPYGPVFEAELARAVALPPDELRTSDCVLKYYEYRSSQGSMSHAGALQCFEHAASTMPELANSWAGLALLLLDVFTFGYGDVDAGCAMRPSSVPVRPLAWRWTSTAIACSRTWR